MSSKIIGCALAAIAVASASQAASAGTSYVQRFRPAVVGSALPPAPPPKPTSVDCATLVYATGFGASSKAQAGVEGCSLQYPSARVGLAATGALRSLSTVSGAEEAWCRGMSGGLLTFWGGNQFFATDEVIGPPWSSYSVRNGYWTSITCRLPG